MNIGENIRYYRKLAGLTQSELANKIGEKQYAITKYEKGIHAPNPEQIEKISDVLGVSIDLLFGKNRSNEIKVAPKKSSRVGKLLDAFGKLSAAQQRAITQQTEALATQK